MSSSFSYAGADLQSMDYARNYHHWVLDKFAHYPAKRILEVGAGQGTFTKHLASRYPDAKIYALEPSTEMYPLLQETAEVLENVEVHQEFTYNLGKFLAGQDIDMVVYNNVLEHVEADVEELQRAHEILRPGGVVVTYSPAMQSLYSKFDAEVGHFRRYSLLEKVRKLQAAGFEVRENHYCDALGMVLWWGKYKLLRSEGLDAGNVKFFDRSIVPLMKRFEPRRGTPLGKNVFAVGYKKSV